MRTENGDTRHRPPLLRLPHSRLYLGALLGGLVGAWLWRRYDSRQEVTVLEFSIDIAAPPTEVFGVVGDPRSKLIWVPAIRRVEMHSDHVLGLGSRYLASSGIAGVEFVFHEKIVAWEPPHRLAYQGKSLWGRFLATWVIEPVPGGSRARYRMDYWFPGGRLGQVLGRLATTAFGSRVNRHTAARLKEAIEGKKWTLINQ